MRVLFLLDILSRSVQGGESQKNYGCGVVRTHICELASVLGPPEPLAVPWLWPGAFGQGRGVGPGSSGAGRGDRHRGENQCGGDGAVYAGVGEGQRAVAQGTLRWVDDGLI